MSSYMKQASRQRFIALSVVAAIICGMLGFAGGLFWVNKQYPMMGEPTFQQFADSYNKIMNDYLEGAEASDLINGAAQGMLESLDDPYSNYMIGEAGNAYTQSLEGEIYGIGVEMRQEDGQFVISKVTKGGPAERGGLLPGDSLVQVDGNATQGKSFQELISLVRGKEGTEVSLQLKRPGETELIDIKLKREAIPLHSVTSEMLENGIGYVTISQFSEKTAQEFEAAIKELEAQEPLKGLLLDMRSNPGGLLQPTLQIAYQLVPKGETILQVVYKNERVVRTYESKGTREWTAPIAVLVNGNSASASEVLTAALKESAGAVVIGETTFGKGVVQAFKQYKDGSVLSLTEAQWKTPSGAWINKVGVAPDYEVKLPEYASMRPLPIGTHLQEGSYGEDVKTLQQALDVLGYRPSGKQGLFDSDTVQALKRFQQAEGLEADGEFNDKTGYAMLALLREKLNTEDTQRLKAVELLMEQIAK